MRYELKNSKYYSENIKLSYDELKSEVDRFENSDVYKLVKDARKNKRAVYSELSFGVKVDDVKSLKKYLNDNTKQSCSEKEVFINGVIDLIIETEDG